jgi:hypothetical protein
MVSIDQFRQELLARGWDARRRRQRVDILITSEVPGRALPKGGLVSACCCDAMQAEITPGDMLLLERTGHAGMTVRYFCRGQTGPLCNNLRHNRRRSILASGAQVPCVEPERCIPEIGHHSFTHAPAALFELLGGEAESEQHLFGLVRYFHEPVRIGFKSHHDVAGQIGPNPGCLIPGRIVVGKFGLHGVAEILSVADTEEIMGHLRLKAKGKVLLTNVSGGVLVASKLRRNTGFAGIKTGQMPI